MICCRLMAIDISCCICPIIFCTALFSDLKSDIAFWVAENASVSFSMPYVLPFMSKSLCRMSRLLPADSASCRSEASVDLVFVICVSSLRRLSISDSMTFMVSLCKARSSTRVPASALDIIWLYLSDNASMALLFSSAILPSAADVVAAEA